MTLFSSLCWIAVFALCNSDAEASPSADDGGRRRIDTLLLEPGTPLGIADPFVVRHPDSFEWHRLRRYAVERLGGDPVRHVESSDRPRDAAVGVAYLETNPREARRHFARALTAGPDRLAAAGMLELMLAHDETATSDGAEIETLLAPLTESEQLYYRARIALEKKNVPLGRRLVEQSATADPTNALARFLWARIELERGQPVRAESPLEEGFYLDPISPDGYTLRVALALQQGRVEAANRAARSGQRRYPDRPRIQVLSVDVDLAAERFGRAKETLEQHIEMRSEFPDVWSPRAARAGWGLRDRAFLTSAVAAWHVVEPAPEDRELYDGYLAYLEEDSERLAGCLARLSGERRTKLEPFAELLRRKVEKRTHSQIFNWILAGVIAASTVGVGLALLRRKRADFDDA